jgi:ribosomal protein RSM22 (predicted rRNA methylase)
MTCLERRYIVCAVDVHGKSSIVRPLLCNRLYAMCRPPRKKAGHVVLDVCSPGSSVNAKPHLEQQVVTRRSHRLGIPLYRLARKMRWGDLWPSAERDWTPGGFLTLY